jgi:hypothetical protein
MPAFQHPTGREDRPIAVSFTSARQGRIDATLVLLLGLAGCLFVITALVAAVGTVYLLTRTANPEPEEAPNAKGSKAPFPKDLDAANTRAKTITLPARVSTCVPIPDVADLVALCNQSGLQIFDLKSEKAVRTINTKGINNIGSSREFVGDVGHETMD